MDGRRGQSEFIRPAKVRKLTVPYYFGLRAVRRSYALPTPLLTPIPSEQQWIGRNKGSLEH